jgi:hypothetical protein
MAAASSFDGALLRLPFRPFRSTYRRKARDVRVHMETPFRCVFGEIFAVDPPTDKRRRASRKVTVVVQQVLLEQLGLGEGGPARAADRLTLVALGRG